MTWFCGSVHKKAKSKVVAASLSKHESIISTEKQPSSSFAVVLQNFTASVEDELSVQRGLVVEQVHVDGEWLYVKNVDGTCGYIPQAFCYPLDKMSPGQCKEKDKGETSARPKPRPLTINLEEVAADTLGDCCGENQPSSSSISAPQRGQHSTTTGKDMADTETRASETRLLKQDSMTGESATTPRPLLPTPTTGQTVPAPTPTLDTPTPTTHQTQQTGREERKREKGVRSPINRANSYKEAVIEADENLYGLMAGIKPSDVQGTLPRGVQAFDKMGTLGSVTSGASHVTDLYSMPDDVFVNQVRKPHGIFRCLESYKPNFRGEIALRKNELVIVLELGQGEWAWVLTSENQEGLVPRNLLVRYRVGSGLPDFSGQCSMGTQTELVVSGPVRELSCSAYAATTSESTGSTATVKTLSPKKPVREKRRCAQDTVTCSTTVQTDSNCLHVSPDWFKTIDSTGSSYRVSPLVSRTPTPQPQSELTESAEIKANKAPIPSPLTLSQPLLSLNTLSLNCKQTHQRTIKSVDFDTESDAVSTISTKRRVQQTPVLTALRDYSPPSGAKNCLSLKKGDVLYIQPHMVQSHTWLWVYHSTHHSFGFVPKNSVAFMYLVQRRERQLGSLEDAV